MPTISLRTVYQTLNDLAAMGELRQLDLGTGSARFDPNLDAHHHLVCERCGKVVDVYADVVRRRLARGRATASPSPPPRSCSAARAPTARPSHDLTTAIRTTHHQHQQQEETIHA